jgi:Ca-activated chloride channel homolog
MPMKRVAVVVSVLVMALVGAIAVRVALPDDLPPVVVVHWSNSHPMREDLLPKMAEEFNAGDHRTPSGHPIQVVLVPCDSFAQVEDLVSRVGSGGPPRQRCKDEAGAPASEPTVVTPQSDDWLVYANHQAGRTLVDLEATDDIAETWLGIVTYRDIATCLGWQQAQVGYEELLRVLERGWEARECASAEWGRQPKVAFTNPATSTTGRNVLASLYADAADKTLGELTVADIDRNEVAQQVKRFQNRVAHYLPGTLPLNTKIVQGSRYGHFFLMPEDNVVSLYQGYGKQIDSDGTTRHVDPVTDLVTIYPKEGSVVNSNPAGIVRAEWVTDEGADAARRWIGHLRERAQQEGFMAAGFRPAAGTGVELDEPQFARWGLKAHPPVPSIDPGDLQPRVLDRIIERWGVVKKRAIVTFVVDVSSSMKGTKLGQVQDGVGRFLDALSGRAEQGADDQVGLVTFADTVETEIAPQPLRTSRFVIADAIAEMKAHGRTALYSAIKRGVELTDRAAGDVDTTRAVVVLSDGEARIGARLDSIVSMITSGDEREVRSYSGMEGAVPIDVDGNEHSVEDVEGQELLIDDDNGVQVFFVGFGEANVHIGRILADATGAEYQGQPDEDLAAVIEELSGYF